MEFSIFLPMMKASNDFSGVGFAVGGYTGINYIVMQIHYARGLKGKLSAAQML